VSGAFLHSFAVMGTVATIQVVGHDGSPDEVAERTHAVESVVEWFQAIESACSRFDAESEVRRLAGTTGVAVPASPILYEALRFALLVAEETDGAFDPTIGLEMERRGFDREYQSGRRVATGLSADQRTSYRDVHLDATRKTITCSRPILLDLGAVAKGFALDIAARELAPFENFAVEAGGDLYLAGHNAAGDPWTVGIRDPRDTARVLETLHVSDTAVCTSGDYERTSPVEGEGHHLVNARTKRSASALASVTVVAESAMVADALATAAFVLGPVEGLKLLERSGVEGLMVSPELERFSTRGMPGAAILRNS
jgi:thiamine biosynthesis lipoprotein